MSFLTSILQGIAIGSGAILPGISSGVLCVVFGIYEKLIDSILNFFKDFKNNFTFLFPIVIGISIGYLFLGNILNYMFINFESQCLLLFLGFILGSLPSLFKEANKKKKFRLSFLFYTIISCMISLLLVLLENEISNSYVINQNSFIFLFLSGFAMSAGVIIPGVSSTVILMCFGTYFIYLEAVSTINLAVLIPMGIGLIFGAIFFLILIRFLLKNYSYQTYYSIIGFVLGSAFILIPNTFNILSVILFIFGFVIAIKLEK